MATITKKLKDARVFTTTDEAQLLPTKEWRRNGIKNQMPCFTSGELNFEYFITSLFTNTGTWKMSVEDGDLTWDETRGVWFYPEVQRERRKKIDITVTQQEYGITGLVEHAKAITIKVEGTDDPEEWIRQSDTSPVFKPYLDVGEFSVKDGIWQLQRDSKIFKWDETKFANGSPRKECWFTETEKNEPEDIEIEIDIVHDITAFLQDAQSFKTTAHRQLTPVSREDAIHIVIYEWIRQSETDHGQPVFKCTNQTGEGGSELTLRFSGIPGRGDAWKINDALSDRYSWYWNKAGTNISLFDTTNNKLMDSKIPMTFSDKIKIEPKPDDPDIIYRDPECCGCCYPPAPSGLMVLGSTSKTSPAPLYWTILNAVSFVILIAATMISVAVNGWSFESIDSARNELLFPSQITIVLSDIVFFLLVFFVIYQIAFKGTSGILFNAIGNLFWIANLLSAAWVLIFLNATEQSWAVWTSALIMLGLAVVLHFILLRISTYGDWDGSSLEKTLVAMTFGVYAGWTVAGFLTNILAIFSIYDIHFADSNECIWLFYLPLVIVYWIFGFKSKNHFYLLVLEVYLLVLPFYGWPGDVLTSRSRDDGLFGGPGNVFSGGDADEWFQIRTLDGDANTIFPGAGDNNKVSIFRPEGPDFVGMNRIVFKSDDGSFDGWTEIDHFKIWFDVLKFETTRSKLDFRPDYYDCHVHNALGHRFATILDAAPDCVEIGLFSEFDIEGDEPTAAPTTATTSPTDVSVPESTLFAGTLALFNIFIVFAMISSGRK